MTEQAKAKKPKKILIVEDERPIAQALELKLTRSGLETKTVYDGEEAVKILKEEKFDLILLDLILPKRDGFVVLNDMKELNISTPVIVLTNLSQEEDFKRAKNLGAKDYFVKSDISLSKIVSYINEILE